MPKSCTGSRYTGYSCSSSRLRKVASAMTGPGVTTWRLVRIRPRSASTTKPVACAVVFHSVSKARVESTSIDTTLPAIRSSVSAQSGLPSIAAACCAAGLGAVSAGAGACAAGGLGGPWDEGCGTAADGVAGVPAAVSGPAAWHRLSEHSSRHSHAGARYRIKDVSSAAEQHEQPYRAQQHEGHEYRGGADVLGQSRQRMPLEADAVDGRLDGAVEQFHDQDQQHRSHQQRALHPAVSEPQPKRYDDHRQCEFLAKRRLLAERPDQAVHARSHGPQYAGQPAGLVTVYGCAVGFHVRSSCLAARTSSRRRTGMVCGALVTRPGSCSASF